MITLDDALRARAEQIKKQEAQAAQIKALKRRAQAKADQRFMRRVFPMFKWDCNVDLHYRELDGNIVAATQLENGMFLTLTFRSLHWYISIWDVHGFYRYKQIHDSDIKSETPNKAIQALRAWVVNCTLDILKDAI